MRAAVTIVLTALATPTMADTDTLSAQERQSLQERAGELRRQAAAIGGEAERQHAGRRQQCYQRFLVNACLDEATQFLRAERDRARAREAEAREIDRRLRRADFADKEKRRLGEAATAPAGGL